MNRDLPWIALRFLLAKADSSNDEEESPAEEDDSSPRKKSAKRSSTSPKLTLTTNEASVITLDDDNNNNTIEFSDRTSSSKGSPVNARATSTLRSHLAPISNSSISFSTNENAQRRDKTARQGETNDQDVAGLADETHLVDKIEAVRNDTEGLAFRIKFIDQDETEWVASKIANRKYPQAVIAFWENHVEFT